MTPEKLDSWIQFQERVQAIQAESAGNGELAHSPILFRGQPNAKWDLDTTLERWSGRNLTLVAYHDVISKALSEVESRTGRRWEVPEPPSFREKVANHDMLSSLPWDGDTYSFMVHLRHHGFPSPLLDWTRSAYVAAYFAFRAATDPARDVAVFAYKETRGHGKSSVGGQPRITRQGPYVRTHERHFLQQSEYTVCFGENDASTLAYIPHKAGFAASQNDPQDDLWKFVLPSSLRPEVLEYLHQHNLTALSLFGSEDSLMEALAIKEFIFDVPSGP